MFDLSTSGADGSLITFAFVLIGIYWQWHVQAVIMNTSARVMVIMPWPKMKALIVSDQKWEAATKRESFLGVSAKDNSRQWLMSWLSQWLLLLSSILLYQFRHPVIGGNGQFLNVFGHRFGEVIPDLKGILWVSFSIISEGSGFPIGPRK